MASGDWKILLIIGVVFVVLGIIALLWGKHEEKRIFDALAEQDDLREFTLEHVESPQPGALRMGGWIAIAIGGLLAIAGIVIYFVN